MLHAATFESAGEGIYVERHGGLSESSFFALFKSATGLTPLDFFIRARMQRAGELLEKTGLRIKEVANVLGYDDQFYFSRLFKSVHGLAPRDYRARQGQATDPNLKLRRVNQKNPAANLISILPRPSQLQDRQRVPVGGFQSAAPSAKSPLMRRRETSPQPV